MINTYKIYLTLIMVVGIIKPINSAAQNYELRGQVSGWVVTNPDEATQ